MANELNLWKRIQGETPKFFKRVRVTAISLAATATILLTAPSVVEGFTLPENIIKYCQWAIVAGLVASGVSSTAVNKPTDKL